MNEILAEHDAASRDVAECRQRAERLVRALGGVLVAGTVAAKPSTADVQQFQMALEALRRADYERLKPRSATGE